MCIYGNNMFCVIFGVFIVINNLKGYDCFQHDTTNNTTGFPLLLQGDWFSWEDGINKNTYIRKSEVDRWGKPIFMERFRQDTYLYVFKSSSSCLLCSKFVVRSWNILERFETRCLSENLLVTNEEENSLELSLESRYLKLCMKTTTLLDQHGYMMYRHDPQPINCQSSIYGHFKFAWLNKYSFTTECNHPDARIISCQEPGNQFSLANQKFFLNFRKCPQIKESNDRDIQYSCLGDWFRGNNQYIAVANLKESRMEEKYRCFVKNKNDQYYLGLSLTPQCDQLKTPENSPIRMKLSPIRKTIQPSCLLPTNITGDWVSSGKGEGHVTINTTHILETTFRGYLKRTDILVCQEHRGNRYLFAKLSEEGCQTEFVCWEMLPRHHNIIRFRKSRVIIRDGFHVCSYSNFRSNRHWKYDTLILKEPDPIPCPIGGRFSFGQKGSLPLEPKIVGGVTEAPLDSYHCNTRVMDMSICDAERKWIVIDTDLCITMNHDGKPIDANSVPDYRIQCVGYWRENLISYLITYDPFDSLSAYRCWVYKRVGHAELRISQALGSACGLDQNFGSYKVEEGAALALNLSLHDRFNDQCPMYYDDGRDPWGSEMEQFVVFRFFNEANSMCFKWAIIVSNLLLICFSQLLWM